MKMEGMMIDALALIGLATTATTFGAKKAVLADCAIKCPRIYEHMAHCHFGRKSASPALSTEGAYLLLVTPCRWSYLAKGTGFMSRRRHLYVDL